MKRLILALSCLIMFGCEHMPWAEEKLSYCGEVGSLTVRVQFDNAFVDCRTAMEVTRKAVAEENRIAGTLKNSWDVTYSWHAINVSGALAQIDESQGLIRVGERNPSNVLHELLHARLLETGQHQTNDHGMICSKGWDSKEREFGTDERCKD